MKENLYQIDALIRKRGLKKKFIAQQLGMRPETLSRKLNNPNTFDAMEMAKLSEILRVRLDQLDFGVEFFCP